jgi:hypothetical protein
MTKLRIIKPTSTLILGTLIVLFWLRNATLRMVALPPSSGKSMTLTLFPVRTEYLSTMDPEE